MGQNNFNVIQLKKMLSLVIGLDNAVIYLLKRSPIHLKGTGNTVKMTFFDFSSAFNTIQPVSGQSEVGKSGGGGLHGSPATSLTGPSLWGCGTVCPAWWSAVQVSPFYPVLHGQLPPPKVLRQHCQCGVCVRGVRLWLQESHGPCRLVWAELLSRWGQQHKVDGDQLQQETLIQHCTGEHQGLNIESEDGQAPGCSLKW